MTRSSWRIFLLIIIFLALTGCASPPLTKEPQPTKLPPVPTTNGAQPTTKVPGMPIGPYGDLRMGLGTFGMEKFDPVMVSSTTVNAINCQIFDFLVGLDGPKVAPSVAEKWEVSPDGSSWTINIRKGMNFHNGEDLNAEDVKFSLDRFISKDAYYAHLRGLIQRVEIIDEYTVRIVTIGTQPFLLRYSGGDADSGQGLILPKDYIERQGVEYFSRNPVGSGPFKLIRHVPGDMVEYEALDSHWNHTPAFKKLTLILIPEETTRAATLTTGIVDAVDIGLESAVELEKSGFRSFGLGQLIIGLQLYGAYDPRSTGLPITDIKVRQALSLAIDREQIRKTLFYGKAARLMPPNITENAADIDIEYWADYADKTYKYDVHEAKRLLSETSFPEGFSMKLYSYPAAGATYLPKLCEIVQGYWSQIGIKAQIVPIDLGVFQRLRGIGSGPDRAPAPELLGTASFQASSERAVTPRGLIASFRSGGTWCLVGKAFPELDKLLDDALQEMNDLKRKDLIAKAIKIGAESWTNIAFSIAPQFCAIGPRVDIEFPKLSNSLSFYASFAKHRS